MGNAIASRLGSALGLDFSVDFDLSRKPVLKSFDISGIAEHILHAPASSIIVMSGAGISTAADIPDFRTPGSGLYDNLQDYDLPSPQVASTSTILPSSRMPSIASPKRFGLIRRRSRRQR